MQVTPVPTLESTAQPLFFDDFRDMSKGWSLGTFGGYTRSIANHQLTLADANHTILTESVPLANPVNNFVLTATFTIISASPDDSIGFYLRGDTNLDHNYRLDFYGNNTYALSKEWLDQSKEPQTAFLLPPISNPPLHPVGQQNTVSVSMNASKLVVTLNNIPVKSVIDNDYTSGQIALFVKNSPTSDEAIVTFSHIVVYPIIGTPTALHNIFWDQCL
ncbi:MAG: hypothetical protein M3Z24_01725 [Chloroflexota bacterium]|nr:hypothetical protein [Chloroflexota bacterium]